MLKKGLVITVLFAASANLCHAATVEVAVDTNNTIANIVANSIIADGEGQDWTGGVLLVKLTSGLVHNGAFDSDLPQAPFWGVFPDLEWDSWVGIPSDNTTQTGGDLGDLGCLECFPLGMEGTHVYMKWFNTRTTDTGPVRVANISLTDDAQGTWKLLASFAGGVFVQDGRDVVNGVMIPEAGTAALLGIGLLGVYRRD